MWRAELWLLSVTLIAAAGWVISKYALREFEPFTFVALRFLLAGVTLALFCLPALREFSRRQTLRSVATGVILGLSLLLWVLALKQTRYVGVGAFIISLNVVLVPLLGRVLFGQVISPALLLALLPSVLGLALITMDNGFVLETDQWLFALSTLGFALHLIFTVRYVQQMPPLALSTVQLLTVGVIAGIAALATESWSEALSSRAWWWLIASALLATSLRFAIQNRVLQSVSASHASMIFLAEPVWTAVLSALTLDERMTGNQIMGCLCILSALLIYRLPLFKMLRRYLP